MCASVNFCLLKKLENIVKNGYKKLLNREPDTGGLQHYISLLEQEKINEFQFHELIKSSQEFMILHPEIIPKIIFPSAALNAATENIHEA